jgi:DNA replication protein DnaC
MTTATTTKPRGRPAEPAALAGIDAAEREQQSYPGLLADALLAECDDRDDRRRTRRMREANFPRDKRLEAFDHQANDAVNPATIATLAAGDWVAAGTPVCLIGDSGTGKTHYADLGVMPT